MARYFPEKVGFIGKLGISRESGTLHFLYSPPPMCLKKFTERDVKH